MHAPNAVPSRFQRFLTLIPFILTSIAGFVAFGLTIQLFYRHFQTLGGVALGVVAGGCLVGGLLLAYQNLVSRLNLGLISNARARDDTHLRDGEAVAFGGIIQVQGEPLTAPFSGTACAAYTYRMIYPRRNSRQETSNRVVAEGFHMLPSRIAGDSLTLRLAGFPDVEPELRDQRSGDVWAEQAQAMAATLEGRAPAAEDSVRFARLLELQYGGIEEAHEDYFMGPLGNIPAMLRITETVVPAGERACVLGVYDQRDACLRPRRSWFGARLLVYKGGIEEVFTRESRDLRAHVRFAWALATLGILLLAMPFAPVETLPGFMLTEAAIAETADADQATVTVSNTVLWTLALSLPVLLLWLLSRLHGSNQPVRHTTSSASPERITSPPVQIAAKAPRTEPGDTRRVLITHPLVRGAAEKAASAPRAGPQIVVRDGNEWYFNLAILTDAAERHRAHDVLTRLQSGDHVDPNDMLWVMELLR